jgi:hypothetical protein
MRLVTNEKLMKTVLFSTLVVFLALNLNSRSEASGSYDSRPSPGPSGSAKRSEANRPVSVDTEKYSLGHKIFLGKIELPDKIISTKLLEKQTRSFEKYKKKLPESLRGVIVDRLSVNKLAGRLNRKLIGIYFLAALDAE